MKCFIMAAAILAIGASGVAAQRRDGPPPGWRYKQSYNWCTEKARRLHGFEIRAASDGRISRTERRTIAELRRDLDASCGGGRWEPNRGWYGRR